MNKKEYQKKYQKDNKEKINKHHRKYYQEHKERAREVAKQWQKKNKDKLKGMTRKYRRSPKGIYHSIKDRIKYQYANNIPLCSQEEFIDWHNKQKRKCTYCNIPEKLVSELKWGRKGKQNYLTIDRMDNNKGYTPDNICLACDICNTMKSNFLTYDEMKEVGKIIETKWIVIHRASLI